MRNAPQGGNVFAIIQAAGWPIWPLILCSVAALAIVIERMVTLNGAKIVPPKLLEEAMAASRRGPPEAKVIQQLAQTALLGRVLAAGLTQLAQYPKSTDADVRASLESAGKVATEQLYKYLTALATIASAAPLIGLLGTVIGMIEIFGSQAGSAATGLSGDPAQLARGISIALYNTAFGLIIAIPSLMAWRYLKARVDAYVLKLEVASEKFAIHLQHSRGR